MGAGWGWEWGTLQWIETVVVRYKPVLVSWHLVPEIKYLNLANYIALIIHALESPNVVYTRNSFEVKPLKNN